MVSNIPKEVLDEVMFIPEGLSYLIGYKCTRGYGKLVDDTYRGILSYLITHDEVYIKELERVYSEVLNIWYDMFGGPGYHYGEPSHPAEYCIDILYRVLKIFLNNYRYL